MNQLDQLLIIYLTTPASDFYLSKMLAKSTDPSLEPFTADTIDAGSFEFFGQSIDVSLTQLSIAGITNIQIEKNNGAPNIQVDGDQVTFVAERPNTEAPPANVPTDLVATGLLEITASGSESPAVPVTVTVKTGELTGVFNAIGDPMTPSSVAIDFTKLTLTTEATSSNIVVDLSQLDSVFKPQVDNLLKQPSTLASLVEKINEQINAQSVLTSVSGGATTAAQGALQSFAGG
ncbi:MAG: hypothetical protein OXE99_09975 [Cellvibrionales bacterium]|nr:hypothetical protein [Cellvibrionales bacterium]